MRPEMIRALALLGQMGLTAQVAAEKGESPGVITACAYMDRKVPGRMEPGRRMSAKKARRLKRQS